MDREQEMAARQLNKKTLNDNPYLGMATSLDTRFEVHHKEQCIKSHGANCLGIHHMNNSTKEGRMSAESDILTANNFTCNDQENKR